MVFSHFRGHPVRLTLSTIKVLCAIHLIGTHGYQYSAVSGPSMMPTFAVDGDCIIADMTHARNRRKALRVGDLVLYRIPVDNASGVKRLLGLPGDYVSMGTPGEKGDDVMIQVCRQLYHSRISDTHTIAQVPEGHCWVIGDNLTVSRDSRHFGPLPLALIQGKVMAKVLPWAERAWIENNVQPVLN
jgi:mitochondrial inner membrane protease subunit 1